MLTLNDGRSELWQWDTGRTLAVDADCSQVHFSNKVFGRSIDVDVVDGDVRWQFVVVCVVYKFSVFNASFTVCCQAVGVCGKISVCDADSES